MVGRTVMLCRWISLTRLLKTHHLCRETARSWSFVSGKRNFSTPAVEAVLSQPTPDGAERIYSPKISQLVDQIANLTLIEVSDLNELLKKRLKLPDAAMMPAGMTMASAAPSKAEDDEPQMAAPAQKTTFTVKLVKFDDGKKINLIKEIKSIVPGLNLVQAKKYVETLPQTVKLDILKEEAEKLKESLAAVGGICEIE